MEDALIEQFCIQMYTLALLKAEQKSLDQTQYRKLIESQLKKSKIPFSKLKPFVLLSKSQWIEDLLEITKDVRLSLETAHQYQKKLKDRARAHFSNDHKSNLSKSNHRTLATKNFISMYEKSPSKQWSQNEANNFCDKILSNTVYLVGLVKANGVIVEKDFIVTCAHALMDEKDNLMKFRCFVTGNGAYGIIKTQKNNVCTQTDVGLGKIIKIFRTEKVCYELSLKIKKSLNFKTQFSPIRCLQVGLLFNNETQDSFIKVFESAQGFIERNLYEGNNDNRLIDDMGLLIHDCYGLWGTSGSPLWTSDGELIGIHNAWNQNGYNISMIVHDDDTTNVRVLKQYERRAIGVHVLSNLFQKWIRNETISAIMNCSSFEVVREQSLKKKLKLQ